ncbi:MAG TPA: hypothetical protein VHX16_01275 [Chloroflexota bacterium]|jgi:hypothetical protein|nr:hypothetical protein [Chloroflexota bacterium]
MGRAPIVFLIILSVVAAQFLLRRRHTRKDLVGRVTERVADFSRNKPVETMVDEVEDLLKEIRKQIKR